MGKAQLWHPDWVSGRDPGMDPSFVEFDRGLDRTIQATVPFYNKEFLRRSSSAESVVNSTTDTLETGNLCCLCNRTYVSKQ